MKKSTCYLFIVIANLIIISVFGYHQGEVNAKYYSDEWIVRLKGGPEVAELIANQFGLKLLGQVTNFKDTYRLIDHDRRVENKRANPQLIADLMINDDRIIWAEKQFNKLRQNRGVIPDYQNEDVKLKNEEFPALIRNKRDFNDDLMVTNERFNDELWDQQWYLQDRRSNSDLPKVGLNVLPCYDLGKTGKGVRISISDDGIEFTHDDLRDNYDPEISYDVVDEDEDPTPEDKTSDHGTRCIGTIAMKANNQKCGIGVAFNAKVGGVRLLNDEKVNDTMESIALGYALDKVDIYVASWGPLDDGTNVDGPGKLAAETIERGIKEGRKGKGAIYIWASGNGGNYDDDCGCDGYTGSIYTLSIGGVTQQRQVPWYSEKCAATFAVTYSGGSETDQEVVATDLDNSCTVSHTGTSGATPLAAGIIALALEINPNLTWRDVQHLVAWTSQYDPLHENEGWLINAAGYWVNIRFGFGLLDAFALVTAAANWTAVPEKFVCVVDANQENNTLKYGNDVKLEIDATGCDMLNYLEHVELQINIDYPVRGNLEVFLTSPSGTKIQLLNRRKKDSSTEGFKNWKLMSVLTWNENPKGVWEVIVTDQVGSSEQVGLFEKLTFHLDEEEEERGGLVGKFTLHLHGTKGIPKYLENGPRQYVSDRKSAIINQNKSEESNDDKDENGWLLNLLNALF